MPARTHDAPARRLRTRSAWFAHAVFGLAALALAALALATSAAAYGAHSHSRYRIRHVCGVPAAGSAECMAQRLLPASLTPADLHAAARRQAQAQAQAQAERPGSGAGPAMTYESPWVGFLTPQLLHGAYALPATTAAAPAQTIAVVDAFNDPTAEADLGVFDRQFELPECTSENGCFHVLNQQGGESPLPGTDGGWAAEISIDVQMAHAICESCHVLLVEADSEAFSDLGAAVAAAVKAGATVVSNSYGGTEEPSYTTVNTSYYNQPDVVITASSGDCGYFNKKCAGDSKGANFPAASPDVVAVGGTTLSESEGVWSSTVWSDGGSGCSAVFEAPLWQTGIAGFAATACASGRSVADVAAVGDPETGVDVYDSTPEGNGDPTGWGVWGGTSVASPIVAAEFALSGGAQNVAYPASTLYAHIGEGDALYDVASGSNGTCAGATSCQATVGFDGPSGVGSPVGLAAFTPPPPDTPEDISPPSISGTAQQGLTLSEAHGEWSNGPTSFSYQWEDCNASGASCSPIAGATAQTYTLARSDVGSTIRVQEIARNEREAGAPAVSARTATVVSDVPTISGFTPRAAISGSTVTIEGTALDGTSEVKFGRLAASYTALSASEIEAIVPDGAVASKISLRTAKGTATSAAKFTPTLSITSFSPKSGPAERIVTVKGVGFTHSSGVSFDGTPAVSVTYVSTGSLKAAVPAEAGTGAITVTNTRAPLGTVSSASAFEPT